MKDRVLLLIRTMSLTAAQFADEIGVQKSGISHIISGRNNPSLDFVQKILLRFPEVSSQWLLFGKGPMFMNLIQPQLKEDEQEITVQKSDNQLTMDLFTTFKGPENLKNETDSDHHGNNPETRRPVESITAKEPSFVKTASNDDARPAEKENIRENESNSPEIEKIVVFYSDRTFREYLPG